MACVETELALYQRFISLVLGCGVHGPRVEYWHCRFTKGELIAREPKNQLLKLRGDGNTMVRQVLAQFVGVWVGVELAALRRAQTVLKEVEMAEAQSPTPEPPLQGPNGAHGLLVPALHVGGDGRWPG